MKISASIYSNKNSDILSTLKDLETNNIDLIHIDCNNDLSVFNEIEIIRKNTTLKIDFHLISDNPFVFFEQIKKYNIDQLTFQFENLPLNFQIPPKIAKKVGLALMNQTSVLEFQKYSKDTDYVLFMTTTPGQSGGEFNKDTFKKIRQFRNFFPEKEIHVDGGVNDKVSFILRNMGVHTVVVGSFLFKDYVGYSVLKIQQNEIKSDYSATDFMMQTDEIPILIENNFDFKKLLQTIEDYKMGLSIISDKNGYFIGLITNADIRKSLLKNIENLNNINTSEIINRNPAIVNETFTVTEIINYVKKKTFPIQFLPVIDNDKKIKGLLRFNNLIKGEL